LAMRLFRPLPTTPSMTGWVCQKQVLICLSAYFAYLLILLIGLLACQVRR
jgi:hypothetical protein